jgi:steroid 5-alpha reductase family enzyme
MLLIRAVSDIPLLEKKYGGNKGFEEYEERTSPYIPKL